MEKNMQRKSPINKLLFIFLTMMVAMSLVLTACGDEYYDDEYDSEYSDNEYADEEYANDEYSDDEEYTDDEEYSDEESDSPSSDSAPSEAPAAGAADSGFRPERDGFGFENYGNDSVSYNLTPAELQRMFGDQVCAYLDGDECTLTPPAKQWMNETNNYMDGGHCEGMAVLSSLMYYDYADPNNFGASTPNDLSLSNAELQQEIA